VIPALEVHCFWALVVLRAQGNQDFGFVCKKNTETLFVNFHFLDNLTNEAERQIGKSPFAKLRGASVGRYNDVT
jgi:hypothetical protein